MGSTETEDLSEDEIKKMYHDYLDEIGRCGVEDYARLLHSGDPIAYQVGLNDFTSEERWRQ